MFWSDPARLMRIAFALAIVVLSNGSAAAFDFARIERWTGSGTNRSALVVDWNHGRNPHALAWGFRWDGFATTYDLLRAITNNDPGLSIEWTNTSAGLRVAHMVYRRPSAHGVTLPHSQSETTLMTPYGRDFTSMVFQTGTWTHWTCDGGMAVVPSNCLLFSSGVVHRLLEPGSWDVFSFSTSSLPIPPNRAIAPAPHYPFASEVISYWYGSGSPPIDWLSGEPFTNAAAALGRPTVDTTFQSTNAPVVPVAAAFRAHEVVSLGSGGYIELAFDHRVLDHPDNPYGLDFIVFGNSFQSIAGGAAWTNGDPAATVLGHSCFVEKGRVYVSQDAITWHAFTNGPFADDFAPTLGRVFDTNHYDTSLGPWNQWWGGATDPTLPIDPSLAPSNWAGFSVAAIAQRYRGGAGGTGFDISTLPLQPDETTGLKWIRYVRIERAGSLNPEIDAIADVSPLLPHARWTLEAFPWLAAPSEKADGSDPDVDGTPNLLEYATGQNPMVAELPPLIQLGVAASHIRVRYWKAEDTSDVRVEVESAVSPDAVWQTNGISQAVEIGAPSNGLRAVDAEQPLSDNARFFRLRVRHED